MTMATDPSADGATRARRAAAQLVADLPPAPAVWCSGLRKRYGRRPAVDNVSLEVGRGEIVGLLGPNGAGKTTVIKMLLGLVHPDAGEVLLLGEPRAIRLPASASVTCPSCSGISRG
jgi:ABC-2 type transport system ATP-binding protein